MVLWVLSKRVWSVPALGDVRPFLSIPSALAGDGADLIPAPGLCFPDKNRKDNNDIF